MPTPPRARPRRSWPGRPRRRRSFSIEAWLKTTANGDEVIAGKGTKWQLSVSADSSHLGMAQLSYGDGAATAYSVGRVDDGAWHHVVAVADRDTAATVFVDGVPGPAASIPNTVALTSADGVRIGAGPTTGFFAGQIDEVAVYKSALSASRIVSHYRLGAKLDSTAPSVTIATPTDVAKVAGDVTFSGSAGSASTDASAVTVTITPDPMAGPLQTFDYDEFGVPQDTGTVQRYGYLGSKSRPAELASGVISMGQRAYVPTLGRFLQTDPVDGGSCNTYDYVCQDPLNSYDLAGTSLTSRRISYAYKYFRSKGLTRAQAAGVVGNLLVESAGTMDPRQRQFGGGPGRGIAQWADGDVRWKGLVKFAHGRGHSVNDFKTQVQYVWHELRTTHSYALKALKSQGTVRDATATFMKFYEAPSDPHLEERIRYANQVYNRFK